MAVHLKPGLMDRRVTIQSKSEARNTSGDIVNSWADLVTVWARKKESFDSEVEEADQEIARKKVTFQIYHRAINENTHRLKIGSVFYDIVSATEIGRKDGLELVCLQKDGGAL